MQSVKDTPAFWADFETLSRMPASVPTGNYRQPFFLTHENIVVIGNAARKKA
jgi:hypothetical protein